MHLAQDPAPPQLWTITLSSSELKICSAPLDPKDSTCTTNKPKRGFISNCQWSVELVRSLQLLDSAVPVFMLVTITAVSVPPPSPPLRESSCGLAHLWLGLLGSGIFLFLQVSNLHPLNTSFSALLKRCKEFVTQLSKQVSGNSQHISKFLKIRRGCCGSGLSARL